MRARVVDVSTGRIMDERTSPSRGRCAKRAGLNICFQAICCVDRSNPQPIADICRHKNSYANSKSLASQALPFSQPCSGYAPSAGQDGPLLALLGPLCGGETETTGPAGGIGTMPIPFRQYRDALSKSPAPAHGLAGYGCPASAKRGGLSLWYLSLYSKHSALRPSGQLRCSRTLLRTRGYAKIK
jgi:hypothetical protein